MLQQDNDPEHTTKILIKNWHQNKFKVLSWSTQSPDIDINIFEHLWAEIKNIVKNS